MMQLIKYHSNGKIKSEVYINNGKMEGIYKEYDCCGNPYIECNYIDGKINGIYKYYNYNYNTIIEYNVLNDKKEGECLHYRISIDKNYVYSKCYYKNNKLEGEYLKYDIYGNVIESLTYKNGLKEGINIIYNKNKIIKIINFINDKKHGERINYYNNNIKKNLTTFYCGYRNGLYMEWWDNGIPKVICNYKEGKLDGKYESYYNNGKLHHSKYYYYGKIDTYENEKSYSIFGKILYNKIIN